MPSNAKHQDFIDLMKAVGMFLIIYGHIVGDPFNLYNLLAQPVHTKQLGVAFFVFLTGWGLANNTKQPLRTIFNRIFPFYFYGPGINYTGLCQPVLMPSLGDLKQPLVSKIKKIVQLHPRR